MQPYGLPDAPFDSVPHDGLANRAGDGETDPGAGEFGFTQTKCGEERSRKPAPSVVDPAKILGSEYADTFRKTRDCYYLSSLTVSFLRPCARRRERTARPFFVSIRERNPCVFARRRLFGWKVRFGIIVQSLSIKQTANAGQIGVVQASVTVRASEAGVSLASGAEPIAARRIQGAFFDGFVDGEENTPRISCTASHAMVRNMRVIY
jgi:hypothetical protein